ncbi:hypothetical protein MIR68_002159 [Amoeboaphelidium protococcarum]|nr:hypothetical protein MIR68_002159 [Amoeboaphelidium protococcarum]
MTRNILVATDFSSCSRYALRIAMEQLLINNACKDKKESHPDAQHHEVLTLVHIIQPPQNERHIGGSDMFDALHEEKLAIKRMQELYEYQLGKLCDSQGNPVGLKINVQYAVEIEHNPAAALIKLINTENGGGYSSHKFSVVVVGSHGQNAAKRQQIGSVSQKILQEAQVPILLAKGQET